MSKLVEFTNVNGNPHYVDVAYVIRLYLTNFDGKPVTGIVMNKTVEEGVSSFLVKEPIDHVALMVNKNRN